MSTEELEPGVFAWSPRPVAARPAGLGSLGGNSHILEPYKIRSPHRIHIGDDVVVGERCFLSVVQSHLGVEHDPVLRIGDGTTVSSDLFVACAGEVEIGRGVEIGARVYIGDGGRDYEDPSRPGAELTIDEPSPVRIGDRATIGIGAIVLSGVTIGERAVVAAGSVVTRSVPPRCVVAGNPARVIERRDGSIADG